MSKLTIDELEIMTPHELGKLLRNETQSASPDFQYIQDLITVGCPIDARDEHGWTKLHRAAWWGHLEMVKFLVSKGGDIEARTNFGWTSLHNATNNGHLEVVKFLLSNGVDIYVRDVEDKTPLDLANDETIESILSGTGT